MEGGREGSRKQKKRKRGGIERSRLSETTHPPNELSSSVRLVGDKETAAEELELEEEARRWRRRR
jgi:hypothetical protein